MPALQLSAEQIEKNYEIFVAQCEQLGERTEAVKEMLRVIGDRLMLCPASSSKDFHRSTPGGLVEHSLRVFINASKLNKSFKWNLPAASIIITSLFHDLGKIGDLEDDFYIAAEDWRKNKFDELYQVNKKMKQMTVPHRSIFLFQHFGIKLEHDEMLAILLNDGFVVEANKEYCLKEPRLATCIWMGDYIATCDEKREEEASV